jgi:nucleoside-diphosphate-sugar epimerase
VNVAITGATGFVGGHLAEALLARGDHVKALARRPAPALAEAGAEIVRGSLDDTPALERLVEGADVVHHVAGVIAARSEAEFLRVNAGGTARLAEAARAAEVGRFVYVSSLAVSGPSARGAPLTEAAAGAPVTPYGRSKHAGEEALVRSGVPYTIVRPPVVYGPHDRAVLRLFRFARRGLAPLLGDGSQELSLVFAADLARALLAAAASPAAEGRAYHAAHPEVVTQRELGQAIGRAVGRTSHAVALPMPVVRTLLAVSGAAARLAGRTTFLEPSKAPELLAPAWTCTSEALARDAGWRAEVGLSQGMEQTARWYYQAGWL